jgi:hypothetical protein
MQLTILGGPHDGSTADVPADIGEGQKFVVDRIEYFYNKPKEKIGRLIYYASSKEI